MPSFGFNWVEAVELVAAAAVGVLIGYQRELNFKPAGITTMSIVSVTSTLLMQLSMRLGYLTEGGDPARLAAAVITGIGFLGAGVIIQTGRHVLGVTTASTIWMVTGIGLAIGAGYYAQAALAVLLAWLILVADPILGRLVFARRRALGQVDAPGPSELPPQDED